MIVRKSRRRGVAAVAVVMLLAGMAGPCWAQASTSVVADARVQRLGDLLVEAVPFGPLLDVQAARDPTWPLKSKASAVTPGQLACLRNEMSSAGYRRAKLEDARQFAAAHPDSVDQDIDLLDGGAALVAGKFIRAGVAGAESGTPVDTKTVMRTVTAQQASSFMTFMLEPKYAALRDLTGLSDMFDMSKSAAENRHMGEQKGASIMMKFMFRAMGNCNVSPASLM